MRKKGLKLSALISLLLCLAICITAAFSLLFSPSKTAQAYSAANAKVTVDNFYVDELNKFNRNALEEIYEKIQSGATYQSLKNSATEQGTAISDKNIVVELGGMKWLATYMFKSTAPADGKSKDAGDNAGDLDITFHLAHSDIQSRFNNWGSNGSKTWPYPEDMYGTSYVRATLVGSDYAHGTGLNTMNEPDQSYIMLVDGSGYQLDTWKNLTTYFGEYIDVPSQALWQKTEQSTKDLSRGGVLWKYDHVNDAYGEIADFKASNDCINYYGKEYYTDWQTDKLWLPSMTEVGSYAHNLTDDGEEPYVDCDGLWKLSWQQGLNNSDANEEIIYRGHMGNGWELNGNNGDSGYEGISSTTYGYVRPAFHLNITAAEANAVSYVDKPAAANITAKYSAKDGNFTLTAAPSADKVEYDVQYSKPSGESSAYDKYTNGSLTFPYKDAGIYTIKATTKPDVYWKDGSSGSASLAFTVTEAQLGTDAQVKIDSGQSFTYNGKAQQPKVTVTLGGVTLPEDDYDVSYDNNVNASTNGAKVIVRGKGNCTGESELPFSIDKASIASAKVEVQGSYTYNGDVQTPTLKVTVGDNELVYGKDYTLTTLDNGGGEKDSDDAGSYKLKLTAAGGNYSGTYTTSDAPFTIGKLAVNIKVKEMHATFGSDEEILNAIKSATTDVWEYGGEGTFVHPHYADELKFEIQNAQYYNSGTHLKQGAYTVTVSAGDKASGNYDLSHTDGKLTIAAADIDVEYHAEPTYGYTEQSITLDLAHNGAKVTLKGGMSEYTVNYTDAYNSEEYISNPAAKQPEAGAEAWKPTCPQVTAAGKYVVYFKITAENHNPFIAYAVVTVAEDTIKVTLDGEKLKITYGDSLSAEQLQQKIIAAITKVESADGGSVITKENIGDYVKFMIINGLEELDVITSSLNAGDYTVHAELKETEQKGSINIEFTADGGLACNIGAFTVGKKDIAASDIVWGLDGGEDGGEYKVVYEAKTAHNHLNPKTELSGVTLGFTLYTWTDESWDSGKAYTLSEETCTKNVGKYKIKLTSVTSDNYKLGSDEIAITVVRSAYKLTDGDIIWNGTEFEFNGDAQSPTASGSGMAYKLSFEYEYYKESSKQGGAPEDAGEYSVKITSVTDALTKNAENYDVSGLTQQSFTITPKEITVCWEGEMNSVYTGSQPEGVKAYYLDVDDGKVYLTLKWDDLTYSAGLKTITVEAFVDGNYKLSAAVTRQYVIIPPDAVVIKITIDGTQLKITYGDSVSEEELQQKIIAAITKVESTEGGADITKENIGDYVTFSVISGSGKVENIALLNAGNYTVQAELKEDYKAGMSVEFAADGGAACNIGAFTVEKKEITASDIVWGLNVEESDGEYKVVYEAKTAHNHLNPKTELAGVDLGFTLYTWTDESWDGGVAYTLSEETCTKNVGKYKIALTSVTSENYKLGSDEIAITIVRSAYKLTGDDIIWNGSAFEFNGEASAPTASSSGMAYKLAFVYEYYQNGVKLGGAPEDAGTYSVKIASVTDSLSDSAGNYDVSGLAERSFTITPKEINVNWEGDMNSVYTGEKPEGVRAYYLDVDGDEVELTIVWDDLTYSAGLKTITVEAFEEGNYKLSAAVTRQYVIIPAPDGEKILISIEVKIELPEDEVLYPSEHTEGLRGFLTVTAHFSNGAAERVYDYEIVGDIAEAGEKTLTVKYGGMSSDPFSLTVASLPSATEPSEGEKPPAQEDNNDKETGAKDDDKFPWWGILIIVIGVLALVGATVAIIIAAKKKSVKNITVINPDDGGFYESADDGSGSGSDSGADKK